MEWRRPEISSRKLDIPREQFHEKRHHTKLHVVNNSFETMRYTKGTFHAKMSTIKDRNGMDLTEAKDIKKRWQEYTEEL